MEKLRADSISKGISKIKYPTDQLPADQVHFISAYMQHKYPDLYSMGLKPDGAFDLHKLPISKALNEGLFGED